ncbi:MAG: RNA-binding protein [Hyphomicrobiaceae bacterium]
MADSALDIERTAGRPGCEPERTCAVTRAKLSPAELIRFVCGPDNSIVPDLAGKLPGRGVWLTCDKKTVVEAVRKNAFARSLKSSVSASPDLPDLVERLLAERCLGAFGFARKAGLVIVGFTKVDIAIEKGQIIGLVHARDAAEDGKGKLDRKFRAMSGASDTDLEALIVTQLSSDELSLAMGRSHVVHAALTEGGAARNFIKEAARLRRYRSGVPSGAAHQLDTNSGSQTEQV